MGEEEKTLSPLKLWGALLAPPPPPPPSGPPGRGSQEVAGTGRGGEAPTGPGFPQPLPERGGGTPGPDPADGQGLFACSWDMGGGGRGGGVSPPIYRSLPPLRFGAISLQKKPAGEVRFWAGNFLPIRCWKTKGFFADQKPAGEELMLPPPPPIFQSEITPK